MAIVRKNPPAVKEAVAVLRKQADRYFGFADMTSHEEWRPKWFSKASHLEKLADDLLLQTRVKP